MVQYIVVEPAFADSTLNSQKAVREHFDANKDFRILSVGSSGYVAKRDLPPTVKMEVRYGKDGTKVMILP